MAGAGYKLFNTGDVLTAAQVNTYLMEQTVMVFADAAARTTALTGVVSEGMISYLKDTNAVEVYDGSNWVSSDDPNAIQNTIVDAKGDLITATASDVPARLAVGNNGETLVADSSASQGLRWQPTGTINGIINGGFDIWQRGTSFAAGTAAYSADRWYFYRTGAAVGATFSRQASDLTGFQYYARLQRDNGNSSTAAPQIKTQIESANSYQFAGKTVSLSFWARKGANFSAASDAFQFIVRTGTGVDETINGSFTGGADSITGTATLTSSWQRFTFSGSIPSTTSEIYLLLYYTPVGTAGAADYVDIAGVQFEIGSTATNFRRSGGTLAGELAACQRYFVNVNFQNTTRNAYNTVGNGQFSSTTNARIFTYLPVQMRIAPTSVTWSGTLVADDGVISTNATAINFNQSGSNCVFLDVTIASGGTQHRPAILYANNDANARLSFSAEL